MRRLAIATAVVAMLVAQEYVGAGLVRRADGRTSPAATYQPSSARPNLIVIVTDDQAHWTLGSYGNTDSRTSQIDRLATEESPLRLELR